MLRHPDLYHRDCQHCLKYLYDSKTGKLETYQGQPIERPRGNVAPCRRRGDSCPKGCPEDPKTLSERNERALHFHRRCKVSGRWPDDGLVLDRAVWIEQIEEIFKRAESKEMSLMQIESLLAVTAFR